MILYLENISLILSGFCIYPISLTNILSFYESHSLARPDNPAELPRYLEELVDLRDHAYGWLDHLPSAVPSSLRDTTREWIRTMEMAAHLVMHRHPTRLFRTHSIYGTAFANVFFLLNRGDYADALQAMTAHRNHLEQHLVPYRPPWYVCSPPTY